MLQEWKKYEAGKKYNGRLDPPYYETVNLNLDFFNGNQWKNLKSSQNCIQSNFLLTNY